ncbi:DUF4335 domain-containing protein [Mastigocladopsis repens]|uniref:DUF4335 domain-containing protein n=1 Tax=Mastigocladopsis repens TaxID=221287 RepID=UPI0004751C8E|nr:DUF4335 domain-containing protein [Mastigocladopsis repens]
MPVSNSVIRRYTPPTCTLEVLAQSSALSQWMGKSILKQLQFELRFDDPRLPEEKRIAIRGDSNQLEALCAVVTNYVQEFLQMSPENFWRISTTKDASIAFDDPEEKDFNNPPSQQTHTVNSFTEIPGADIQIKPSSHLTHNLFLGSLATQASGHVIELSLLQLFDLATALDEYSADVMALPNLTPRSARSRIPTWAPVAAVLVIGVGLAPVTWQYANHVRQQETAKKQTSTQEKIALEPSPSQNLSTPTAVPTFAPPDLLPSQSLPPFGSTLPVPNSTGSPPIAQTLPSVPATPQTSATSLPATLPTSPSLGNFSTAPLPSSGSTLNIPGTTKPPSLSTSPPNLEPKQRIAIQSNPRLNNTTPTPNSGASSGLTQQNLPPSNLPSNIPPDTSPVSPPSIATLPDSSIGANREPSYSQPGTSVPSGTDILISRLREARRSRSPLSTEVATTSTSSETLFDTAQVSQARDVLKKRWQPPSGLRQSIEYSLVVGVDGKIERILPLGKAARDYVDRTGMPLIGEPFVSPNKNGQPVKIRAVFSPDGKVQAFPETE